MSEKLTTSLPDPTSHVVRTDVPIRLDRYLTDFLSLSRRFIQQLISADRVSVNDQVRTASYLLKNNDRLLVNLPPRTATSLTPADLAIHVVFEDEQLAVLDKPAGIAVHPVWGALDEPTVVSFLLFHYSDLPLFRDNVPQLNNADSLRPGIVHRLDKYTSGLLVVAKTIESHGLLKIQFRDRTVRKEYSALVDGHVSHDSGFIDQPLHRSEKNFQKFTVSPAGKEAYTEYAVTGRYRGFNRSLTLVSVKPLTGRTHQIRVHFASIHHPLVGDKLYGGPSLLDRYFLHAAQLSFIHPKSNEVLSFVSPLPVDLSDFIGQLQIVS